MNLPKSNWKTWNIVGYGKLNISMVKHCLLFFCSICEDIILALNPFDTRNCIVSSNFLFFGVTYINMFMSPLLFIPMHYSSLLTKILYFFKDFFPCIFFLSKKKRKQKQLNAENVLKYIVRQEGIADSMPQDLLNLINQWICYNDKQLTYELIGILVHAGSTTQGRYFLCFKNIMNEFPRQSQWIRIHDRLVTFVDQQHVSLLFGEHFFEGVTFKFQIKLAFFFFFSLSGHYELTGFVICKQNAMLAKNEVNSELHFIASRKLRINHTRKEGGENPAKKKTTKIHTKQMKDDSNKFGKE
ncbi:hypothetical protein RFI_14889 [Reticulomyxa filosa]|uniref:Peptidase C19 ubiquitin carboxyl-terminal hydrolase domain-containing protein n=1 Tax=Reticulomyxa filosa TaxID=46433 RepID=X6N976_RETFI|nr:hypothetical protein RFI_14889 [Reticulomyxa filosa]|eukprot:ETO22309.1 hypothetical protein RFI_14889 [Reticulomyxa filosa]